jgi:hypothetical protein
MNDKSIAATIHEDFLESTFLTTAVVCNAPHVFVQSMCNVLGSRELISACVGLLM